MTTTTPKHTPGPWRTQPEYLSREQKAETGRTLVLASSGLPIATVNQHDEREANARLIAAAPEMRTMLERLLTAWLTYSEFASDARALLARIDGETR